jgi:outer membrane protein assembly factor BamE (lipoprotein component of BamABCDE complex)
MRRILIVICAALAGAPLLAGCSTLGVKPWQRELLSRQDMQLDGNGLDAAIDDHLYFSKEASSGGRSFAGGGCGCN